MTIVRARRGALAVITGFAVWGFTAVLGLRPQPVLVVVTTVAWIVVGTAVLEISEHRRALELGAPRRPGVSRHGLDSRFSRLARSLRSGPDPQRVAEEVHETLVDIVDDLLLSRHGIDRQREPDAARAILSPDVARYVDEPPRARRDQLVYVAAVTSRIEAM